MKFKFITIVLNFSVSHLRNNFISNGFVCFIKLCVTWGVSMLVGIIYFSVILLRSELVIHG